MHCDEFGAPVASENILLWDLMKVDVFLWGSAELVGWLGLNVLQCRWWLPMVLSL